MLVDRCAGTAQLKKLGFCRAKTRSRTFRMTLSLIFQNKGTAGANHRDSLFFLSYSLITLASHVFSPHGEDLLYKINALRAGRAEG